MENVSGEGINAAPLCQNKGGGGGEENKELCASKEGAVATSPSGHGAEGG